MDLNGFNSQNERVYKVRKRKKKGYFEVWFRILEKQVIY